MKLFLYMGAQASFHQEIMEKILSFLDTATSVQNQPTTLVLQSEILNHSFQVLHLYSLCCSHWRKFVIYCMQRHSRIFYQEFMSRVCFFLWLSNRNTHAKLCCLCGTAKSRQEANEAQHTFVSELNKSFVINGA